MVKETEVNELSGVYGHGRRRKEGDVSNVQKVFRGTKDYGQ
jgi:hypothetical protein